MLGEAKQLLEEELGSEILETLNLHHISIDKLNMKDMIKIII